MLPWYRQSVESVLASLGTDVHGLAPETARARLAEYGPNQLPEAPEPGWVQLFLKQFASPLIYLLLLAGSIVWWLGEPVDGIIIFAVLLINAVIGVIQEGRAQSTLRALRRYVTTSATALRARREVVLPDTELVPGDVVMLREGDRVPADARILSAESLSVDESALTGESEPVTKTGQAIAGEALVPGDQRNMVFRGSFVTRGAATVVVVATGEQTEIGKISRQLEAVDADVPLKKAIVQLSRVIIVIVLSIAALLFAIGVATGLSPLEMFRVVVAIVVSAIPEGLPVVVTLILATGVARMSQRKALVKRLQAVEALGSARVIAVDKTGTITKNQMMVSQVYVAGRWYEIGGSGYDPDGEVSLEGASVLPVEHEDLLWAGKVSALTAAAAVAWSEEKQSWERMAGDPTEAALLVFGRKLGYRQEELLAEHPRLSEMLFTSDTRFHAVVNVTPGQPLLSVAGAPEVILSRATQVWRDGAAHHLGEHERAHWEEARVKMMQNGLRVLALAIHQHASRSLDRVELPPLTLVGLVGIHDGLRPEVAEAVAAAHAAGVRVVMITGDHRDTAVAIAQAAGIYRDGDWVVTGAELEAMSAEELAARLDRATVFARVSPEHKLKIIEGYKLRREIVAMTGDGVNDALSLAAADLGVAMGRIGTEVAKSASDIILLDDNFGSVVAAIEEGRNIYRTIQKVILYLFSTSLGEVFTIAAAIVAGWPLPVLASQIIWLNFVTDGFLVVALAFEPKEKNLLRTPAARTPASMVTPVMIVRMVLMAVVMTVGTLWLFSRYLDASPAYMTTIALTSLAVFQWFNAYNVRSETRSAFNRNIFENIYLAAAFVAVVLLQLAAVYLPGFQAVLRTTALSFDDWLLVVGVGLSIVLIEELRKALGRWRYRAQPV